jgi:hypothetical protein
LKGKKEYKHILAIPADPRDGIAAGPFSQLALILLHSSILIGGRSSLPGYRIE